MNIFIFFHIYIYIYALYFSKEWQCSTSPSPRKRVGGLPRGSSIHIYIIRDPLGSDYRRKLLWLERQLHQPQASVSDYFWWLMSRMMNIERCINLLPNTSVSTEIHSFIAKFISTFRNACNHYFFIFFSIQLY